MLIVTSTCGQGFCRTRAIGQNGCFQGTEPGCVCVPSVPGAQCAECNGAGYINPGTSQCVCAAPHDNQDPNIACLPVVPVSESLPVNSTLVNVPCACFNSTVLGCFAPTNALNVYGTANPQSCNACCNLGFGPYPGTVDDTLAGNVPSGKCTQYGTLTKNSTVWTSCSGNGAWNSSQVGCECGLGWTLAPTGFTDFYGNQQLSCTALAPGYGPGPRIYGPNPLNGTFLECSGLGTYQQSSNTCLCYQGANATESYFYEAETYQLDRTRPGFYIFPVAANVSVQTCGLL